MIGKGLLGAGKALVGQLTDGQKGVNLGAVLKGGAQGAASAIPGIGGLAANAIGGMGGGAQQQQASLAPGAPGGANMFGQAQPGGILNGMIQQAHGGMVYHNAGGPTPEQLAEASQILANMGKEEKLAKYGMMSDEAILQEIAKGLDGGEAAPAPYQPEASAPADYLGSDEQKADIREAQRDVEREEAIREGGSRSAIQALYDEVSQLGAGLAAGNRALDTHSQQGIYTPDHVYGPSGPGVIDAFKRGYGRREQEHRDRMASGAKGPLDARNPFSVIGDFVTGSETTGLNSATFKPGRGVDFVKEGIARRESPVRQGFGGRVKLRKRH